MRCVLRADPAGTSFSWISRKEMSGKGKGGKGLESGREGRGKEGRGIVREGRSNLRAKIMAMGLVNGERC